MRTIRVLVLLLGLVLACGLLADGARADSITWTDPAQDDVSFLLSVSEDDDWVTATLTVTTASDYTLDEYLTNVAIKIWAQNPPGFDLGALTSDPDFADQGGGGDYIKSGFRWGDGTGTLQQDAGWIGADANGDGEVGVLMGESESYVFVWKWDKNDPDWNASWTLNPEWSIKMWPAEDLDATRSRQWSSGGLTPVPEPGSIALVGLGLFAVAGARRHRRRLRR